MMNQLRFNLKAYHLVNGQWEIFRGITIRGYSLTGKYLKVQFEKGLIFGVQYIKVTELDHPVVFAHKDLKFKILFK